MEPESQKVLEIIVYIIVSLKLLEVKRPDRIAKNGTSH